ncbi:MAG: hypothetical protein A2X17_02160 [Bacteroidetes bacterium GWF2_41_61]|nr:MAG: hypothetical protein A2X17_02160 [Bacteroidetes bacterium GWF2_41_61]OFY88654.1 MAG: hypothetical protein A2266_00560 [Bacteroidetes bacterium RIFOXYA12_FULL_40_10]
MKRVVLLFLLIAFGLTNVNAQNETSLPQTPSSGGNAIFFELGGHSLIFGFNYDTRFNKKPDGIGGRVGIGYMAVSGARFFSLPVAVNYLMGKDGKYFEMGAGATLISMGEKYDYYPYTEMGYSAPTTTNRTKLIGNISFGFRRQPVNSGFMFRAGVAPVFGLDDDKSFFFFPFLPYISFGYAF